MRVFILILISYYVTRGVVAQVDECTNVTPAANSPSDYYPVDYCCEGGPAFPYYYSTYELTSNSLCIGCGQQCGVGSLNRVGCPCTASFDCGVVSTVDHWNDTFGKEDMGGTKPETGPYYSGLFQDIITIERSFISPYEYDCISNECCAKGSRGCSCLSGDRCSMPFDVCVQGRCAPPTVCTSDADCSDVQAACVQIPYASFWCSGQAEAGQPKAMIPGSCSVCLNNCPRGSMGCRCNADNTCGGGLQCRVTSAGPRCNTIVGITAHYDAMPGDSVNPTVRIVDGDKFLFIDGKKTIYDNGPIILDPYVAHIEEVGDLLARNNYVSGAMSNFENIGIANISIPFTNAGVVPGGIGFVMAVGDPQGNGSTCMSVVVNYAVGGRQLAGAASYAPLHAFVRGAYNLNTTEFKLALAFGEINCPQGPMLNDTFEAVACHVPLLQNSFFVKGVRYLYVFLSHYSTDKRIRPLRLLSIEAHCFPNPVSPLPTPNAVPNGCDANDVTTAIWGASIGIGQGQSRFFAEPKQSGARVRVAIDTCSDHGHCLARESRLSDWPFVNSSFCADIDYYCAPSIMFNLPGLPSDICVESHAALLSAIGGANDEVCPEACRQGTVGCVQNWFCGKCGVDEVCTARGCQVVMSIQAGCTPGQFVVGEFCQLCPEGNYSNVANAGSCQACMPLSFQPSKGQTACLPCPTGAVSSSSDRTSCVCDENQLFDAEALTCDCIEDTYAVDVDGLQCRPCPNGAYCAGSSALPVAKPGYYLIGDVSDANSDLSFVRCVPEQACLGASQCDVGYVGLRCASCDKGYYRPGKTTCDECPANGALIPVLLMVLLILLASLSCVFTAYRTRVTIDEKWSGDSDESMNVDELFAERGAISQLISIYWNHLQLIAIIFLLDLRWPSFLFTFLTFLRNLVLFGPNVLATACAEDNITNSYQFQLLIRLLLPPVLVISAALATFVYFLLHVCGSEGGALRRLFPLRPRVVDWVNASVPLVLAAHIIVVLAALELFDCSEVVGVGSIFDADATLLCYDDWWHSALPLSALGVAVYVVGVPLVLLVLFGVYHRSLWHRKLRRGFADRHSLLLLQWRSRWHYWEITLIARRTLLATVSLFLGNVASMQAGLSIGILVVLLLIHMAAKPYRSPLSNSMEAVSLAVSVALIAVGLGVSSADILSESAQAIWATLLLMAILVTSIAFIAAIVWTIVLRYRQSQANTNVGKDKAMMTLGAAVAAETDGGGEQVHLWSAQRVADWLRELGMFEVADALLENDVDGDMLISDMSQNILRACGIDDTGRIDAFMEARRSLFGEKKVSEPKSLVGTLSWWLSVSDLEKKEKEE